MSVLVVVSGLPATGKSTLSDRLGHDLGVPTVHRDRLRRAVFAGFVEAAPEVDGLIPAATTTLVLQVLASIFAAGGGAVLDGNFNTPEHASGLDGLLGAHDVAGLEVCLWGDPEVLRQRFVERAEPPLTDELRPYFEEALGRPRRSALGEERVVAHVDTTDFGALNREYAEILGRVQGRKGPRTS